MNSYRQQLRALTEGICELYNIEITARDECHKFVETQIKNMTPELKYAFHAFSIVVFFGIFICTATFPKNLSQADLKKLLARLRAFPVKPVREYVYFLSNLCVLKGFERVS